MSQQKVLVDEEAAREPELTYTTKDKEAVDGSGAASLSSNNGLETPVAALAWDSPEDPGNPKNWPLWRRIFHTSIPALFGFVM
jgi:hypothetical protein